jgi:biopolymer transport protein ExbB
VDIFSVVMQAGGQAFVFLARGGLMMLPLLASSILSLAIIIERWLFWRRLGRHEAGATILALVAQGHHKEAVEIAQASQHPVACVLHAGLVHAQRNPGMAMEAAAQTELVHLRRFLPALDTIITLAPLLGLLGTITGMISAFGIVSDVGLGQPHAITGGIAEALIATATGLAVAIITLIPYNYFQARAEAMTARIEAEATRLELLLQASEE